MKVEKQQQISVPLPAPLFEFVTRTAARRGGASHASVIRSCIEAAAIAEAAQADESRERAA